MRLKSRQTRLLAIVLSVLIIGLVNISHANASASVAIVVYDHGFTRQLTWTRNGHLAANKTSSFTQDDQGVYAYLTAGFSNASVTFQWYDPNGQLYNNYTETTQCAVSPCSFLSYLSLAHTEAATRIGLWTMSLQAGGTVLYSDHFSLETVIAQDNYWSFTVIQSAPPRVHCDLTVTIHPNNRTWSYYVAYLPSAANVTAHEYASNRTLYVKAINGTNRFVVDLRIPRPDGYRFVLSFDVAYGLTSLGGWDTGNFAFSWEESSWDFDGYHPVPGSFSVTLPKGAAVVDVLGKNAMTLDQNVTLGLRPAIAFTSTLEPTQIFGWTILYNDPTYQNSHLSSTTTNSIPVGFNAVLSTPIPVLPITLGVLSLWTAVMSMIILTASEILSPISLKTGMLINRRRLRIAALFLIAIFIAVTAYQVILFQSITAQVPR